MSYLLLVLPLSLLAGCYYPYGYGGSYGYSTPYAPGYSQSYAPAYQPAYGPMHQPTRRLDHLTVARTAALLIILGHARRRRITRSLTIRVIDTESEHRINLAVRALS
jgi:hypothetical protein